MRDKCIGQELSWERPAVKWEAVLEELFYGSEAAAAAQPPRPSLAEAKASVTTPVQVCQGLGLGAGSGPGQFRPLQVFEPTEPSA